MSPRDPMAKCIGERCSSLVDSDVTRLCTRCRRRRALRDQAGDPRAPLVTEEDMTARSVPMHKIAREADGADS